MRVSACFSRMWEVAFADEFEPEFAALGDAVQDELLAQARMIEAFGPLAKRPRVDTLKGAWHSPSTTGGVPCCWSRATSPGVVPSRDRRNSTTI